MLDRAFEGHDMDVDVDIDILCRAIFCDLPFETVAPYNPMPADMHHHSWLRLIGSSRSNSSSGGGVGTFLGKSHAADNNIDDNIRCEVVSRVLRMCSAELATKLIYLRDSNDDPAVMQYLLQAHADAASRVGGLEVTLSRVVEATNQQNEFKCVRYQARHRV